jgi:hypothetical protein
MRSYFVSNRSGILGAKLKAFFKVRNKNRLFLRGKLKKHR